ncbi:hypothetical protein AAV35_004950 [Salimicrobium jeotgali]|uniref:ATPase AAA-type core domain-containing protein n=1 Tax=Salimicrobium jeotgali TaxID=1230341 RepID=K2FMQ9_9BACI|nr:AAA family ATPase [Salimicrobium jeotgali]AKG04191.1 hypothetical protein AAV35_004950 [Salimicrobium jeotgali]EKE32156.1 hypothetical protein MJ3_04269 [Salimicrobium jeotgali]MBM7695767.1 AAA15 family ATPase/GTPase [Salimicrobium jeotgali]
MRVTKLKIHEFRKFKNNEVKFGKKLTCISGHNAVGKSTILGILANSSELNKKTGTTINGGAFRADLKEIMKFSEEFDPSGSQKCTLEFTDLPNITQEPYLESISFRATWQKKGKENNKRYRLLPMPTEERHTVRKYKFPTLYLGMSRLYPIGEVDDKNVNPDRIKSLTDEEKNFVHDNHKWILANNDSYKSSHSVNLKNTKKTGFGIETEQYDALSNSAGQDNLGQILLSLLSFKRLKKNMGEDWVGGLLLIDEVDATLHPIAQNRLFDFLSDFSKTYDIQIIFTTHSLSLLEHIDKNIDQINHYHESENRPLKSIELNYLSTDHGSMKVHTDLNVQDIKSDLLNTYSFNKKNEIKIYSEDNEARWFFDELIGYCKQKNFIKFSSNKLEHVSVSLGKNQLLKLLRGDFNYFSKNLTLLDGDVEDDDIRKELRGVVTNYSPSDGKTYNIIKLPGGESPEKLLWDYALDLPEGHPFYADNPKGISFKKTSFIDNGPNSANYTSKHQRENFKEWFKDHELEMNQLIWFWLDDHQETVVSFLREFKFAHDFVAKSNLFDEIIINDDLIKSIEEKEAFSGQNL